MFLILLSPYRCVRETSQKKISSQILAYIKNSFYLCTMNIKQEFGKWFLDVAKYVITAMLLTAMIDGLSQVWLILVSALVTMLCLIFGAVLMRKGKDEEDRRERNRMRHWEKVKNGGK